MKNVHNYVSAVSALVLGAIFLALQNIAWSETKSVLAIPEPFLDEIPNSEYLETTVFAGGCFWGMQGVFQHIKGVTNVVSGYAGGKAHTAYYASVSRGMTDHAESIQITFNPRQVTYGQLLQIFFSVAHNPTELNRQGPDYGKQYRSAVFPMNDSQKSVAEAYITQLNRSHIFDAPIVTEIEEQISFYPAEKYHQNFLNDNPKHPYIVINDAPKLVQLKKVFPAFWNDQAVLVKDW